MSSSSIIAWSPETAEAIAELKDDHDGQGTRLLPEDRGAAMNVTVRSGPGAWTCRSTAPPSKSYTHRALIAGALAEGTTTVLRPAGCRGHPAHRRSAEGAGGEGGGAPRDDRHHRVRRRYPEQRGQPRWTSTTPAPASAS